MKRQILSLTAGLVVLIAGAVFAQSSLNTPAPGPSQETKPGQTNNNLQNPGNPQMQQQTDKTVRENGTAEGTAVESTARTQAAGSTTSTPVNDDQTSTAPPADTTNTTAPPADTTTTTTTTTTTPTTGTYNGSATSTGSTDASTTTTTSSTQSLPKTASDLPTVALMGLLALSGFFALRVYAKRNA